MRSLNLDQLRTLQTVAETGGFTAAAKRLHLSQSAISTQIKELEDRLGVRLVERLGKKAFPTPAGQELIGHANHILTAADTALSAMRRYSENWLGRVRIVCHETICNYLLNPAMRELRVSHPNLEIVFMIAATAEAVPLVLSNDADLGIITMPVENRALEIVPVYEEPLLAILPPSARRAPATINAPELAKYPLILDVARGQVALSMRKWFEDGGVVAHPVMELNAHEAVKRLIAGGFGAAILPLSAVEGSKDIVTRPLDPPMTWRLGMIRRQDKPIDPALKIMQEAITRHLKARMREKRRPR